MIPHPMHYHYHLTHLVYVFHYHHHFHFKFERKKVNPKIYKNQKFKLALFTIYYTTMH